MADRYANADDTTWPVPWPADPDKDGPGWRMRYGPHPDLFVASIVDAYFHLVDPWRTTTDAIESLRRARRAMASVRVLDQQSAQSESPE